MTSCNSTESLLLAIKNRQFLEANAIVKQGLDVNKPFGGEFPLFAAISFDTEDNGSMIGLLLANGAWVNHCDSFGRTPLHLAIILRRKRITRLLLRLGADPRIPDKTGFDCFHYAIGYQDEPLARDLMDRMFRLSLSENHVAIPA